MLIDPRLRIRQRLLQAEEEIKELKKRGFRYVFNTRGDMGPGELLPFNNIQELFEKIEPDIFGRLSIEGRIISLQNESE